MKRSVLTLLTMPIVSVALIYSASSLSVEKPNTGFSEAQLIRGVIAPEAQAVLASMLVASVKQTPFKSGDKFNAGDLLIEFECERYAAEHTAIKTHAKSAKATFKSNEELARHKALGKHELTMSGLEFEKAQADVRASQTLLDQCEVIAPFSGQVVEMLVNEFETPETGSPLISIVNDSSYKLSLIVPSVWLNWIEVGSAFEFSVDETGQRYKANVSRVGAVVDPVSQTIKLEGRFIHHPEDIKVGMSGSAFFAEQSAMYDSGE